MHSVLHGDLASLKNLIELGWSVNQQDESLKIAVDIFRALLQSSKQSQISSQNSQHRQPCETSMDPRRPQASSTTFLHFLKVIRRLPRHRDGATSTTNRAAVLSKTIRIGIRLGLVNHFIVHQAQLGCQSQLEWEVVGGELAEYVKWNKEFDKRSCRNIPKEWTKNARRWNAKMTKNTKWRHVCDYGAQPDANIIMLQGEMVHWEYHRIHFVWMF